MAAVLRDSSSAGLTRLRRDAIAYIDVKLSGAGDASAGQDPAAGMSAAWAAARAANALAAYEKHHPDTLAKYKALLPWT